MNDEPIARRLRRLNKFKRKLLRRHQGNGIYDWARDAVLEELRKRKLENTEVQKQSERIHQ